MYCACVVGLRGRGDVVMWGGAVVGLRGGHCTVHALFFRVFCYKILKCKSLRLKLLTVPGCSFVWNFF